ncbi:MAG: hypothetical protein J6Q51_03750 [Clostridia bacterium]|nr:hypothetical protein [Clostridia bacterium]
MDKKFEIIKSGKIERKSFKDIQKYEVATFEYGDYDNWVNAILLDVKLEDMEQYGKGLKRVVIRFACTDGREITCYDSTRTDDYYLDIIGYAVENMQMNVKNNDNIEL